MDETTRALLLACDSATELEEPIGFDRETALDGVRALQKQIHAAAGIDTRLDDTFQDASVFAALYENTETQPTIIRFSTFGKLVTIYSLVRYGNDMISVANSDLMMRMIVGNGYVYVPIEILLEPYSGLCKPLVEHQYTHFRRFFDHI